ncbi:hypothetical protein N7449_008523 [Penicillium cf. viridicatum]|uniref:Uncharacterized protein n=1 Tax=Penicillium cf. viridicatum TaxID=2972119 RepID=A0A9W9JAL0_9EURO|nr:hypothetical protein N7449_008523 [Penicillium cf. viridicatum]
MPCGSKITYDFNNNEHQLECLNAVRVGNNRDVAQSAGLRKNIIIQVVEVDFFTPYVGANLELFWTIFQCID